MRWIALAILWAASPPGFAASFDCSKASTPAEKRVCASPGLSSLDDKLGATYRAALDAAEGPSKHDLQVEQRHWVAFVRDICGDEACMAQAYEARIALLARNERVIVNEASCEIPEGKSCRSVVRYRDTSVRIASFNASMKADANAGSIIGCDRLIDLPVGLRDTNHSFGAFCTVATSAGRQRVKVCNDNMFGHFALEPVQTGTDSELCDFTNQRCFGG